MTALCAFVAFQPVPAARGIGRLIGKMMEGDPVAIGIGVVVGIGVVGYFVYQKVQGD